MKPHRIPPKPGQESVWDYPRPPRIEPVPQNIQIYVAGKLLADTKMAYRILETSHPPTYYLPPADIRMEYVRRFSGSGSFCEYKGRAHYYDLEIEGKTISQIAWAYDNPSKPYAKLKDHLAFYAHKMDRCLVAGELVTPQPGNFYGGWITSKIVGPFKGEPGTWGW